MADENKNIYIAVKTHISSFLAAQMPTLAPKETSSMPWIIAEVEN